MFEILFFSLLIMAASLVGVFSVWRQAGAVVEANLDFLVSFSAGVFSVITYHLAAESIEHAGLEIGLGSILIGAIFISIVFRLLPALHRHSAHVHGEGLQPIDARRMLISDGIHNAGDGILLAVSFAAGPVVGAATAVSIIVHELLQEISEFFVLRDAGYSTGRALLINFAVSGTILIGSVGGFLVLDLFEMLEAPLLGFAAGAFLVVVLGDLIPHSFKHSVKTAHYAWHLLLFVFGSVLMFTLATGLAHS